MKNFPHLRRISQAKWMVVRELILLWTLKAGGAVRQWVRLEDGLEARVAGTYTYRVTVRDAPGGLVALCACPYKIQSCLPSSPNLYSYPATG
jgi:hypothetical protein